MRNYDKEFKLNAIKLYRESSRSMKSIANELGIPPATFHQWIKAHSHEGESSFPGKGHTKSLDTELIALRKELHHVRLERDILKKAVAIFSVPQGKGTHS